MIAESTRTMNNINEFLKELEYCRKCNNCQRACPICYCCECIFDSDLFDHSPEKYLEWVEKKGVIRIPTDTLMFHMTRMAHMALSCVGCGQCTSINALDFSIKVELEPVAIMIFLPV